MLTLYYKQISFSRWTESTVPTLYSF